MPTTISAKSKLPALQIEEFASSVADLVVVEKDHERVIGQAWIAGAGLLVTCGHIVEEQATKLGTLIAKFPATNQRYSVLNIRMHPQYHKEAPMFGCDMAVLTVELGYPERELAPLPVRYQKKPAAREQVYSLRFNVIDGRKQRSEAVAVTGQFSSGASKENSGQIIHNLPLSAENIGCPIFDEDCVVAIHCGNLALKPGQTTAEPAKVALAISALRELNLTHYREELTQTKLFNGIQLGAGFIISVVVIGILLWVTKTAPQPRNNDDNASAVTPILVTFNKPVETYRPNDELTIKLQPHSDCYLTVIIGGANSEYGNYPLWLFYPRNPDADQKPIASTGMLDVGQGLKLQPREGQSKMHIFACKEQIQIVKKSDLQGDANAFDDTAPHPLSDASLNTVRRGFNHYLEGNHERPGSAAEIEVELPVAQQFVQ